MSNFNKSEIFIFRHGETDWNRELRFQGHTDIPLNETGREQALLLKKKIEKCRPHIFFSSDLMRAQQTAGIVNSDLKLPIHLSSDLRECRMGDCEGMLREEMSQVYGPQAWERWKSIKPEDQDFGFPNGEIKSEHLKRIRSCLEMFCIENPQWNRIAVSTHGGSLRRLVHSCLNAPLEPVALGNCVLYHISFEHQTRQWAFHGLVED